MHKVILLLGSNLGDKLSWLEKARNKIEKNIGEIKNHSSIYQTEPWGFSHEEDFCNQVIQIQSRHNAFQILTECLGIEEEMGRKRKKGNYEARNIDIDILFYDHEIIKSPELGIPHPRLHMRRFTLVPLCEVAPHLIHPVIRKSMLQLLEECQDQRRVHRLNYRDSK